MKRICRLGLELRHRHPRPGNAKEIERYVVEEFREQAMDGADLARKQTEVITVNAPIRNGKKRPWPSGSGAEG